MPWTIHLSAVSSAKSRISQTSNNDQNRFYFLFLIFELHLAQYLHLFLSFFDYGCPLIDDINSMREKVTAKLSHSNFWQMPWYEPAIIMDKEGDSSKKILEFSFGSRGIISHMWEMLTLSFNSKELPNVHGFSW